MSEAGSREASLTSINLLSSHPSALHRSLSSSFYAPLLILGALFFFPLLRMSSSLFDLNVRRKGHSHHAALRYHCGFLASAKTSYSFNHHKMCRQTHVFLCTRGGFFPALMLVLNLADRLHKRYGEAPNTKWKRGERKKSPPH